MRSASDNATVIKANVYHLPVWKSVQQIGVEKCRSNYLAESEQVPLPVTALIAPVLLQILNQTNISIAGHTNEMMKCADTSQCSYLNKRTNCTKATQVNLNKVLSLIDPGKNWDFTFRWNWGGRVKDTRCFKNLSWFIKKSLSPEPRGNRINLCSQCMCVWDTAEWFSSCLWGVISSGVACLCSTGLFSAGTRLAVSSEPWSSVCGENNMQWTSFSGAWGVTLK